MTINRVARFVCGAISLLVTCAMVGAGVGFFQGEIVSRRFPRVEQIAFAEGAAFLGTIVALFLGPLLYALLLRYRMSVSELCAIVACSAVGGGLVALLGWEIAVPLTSVFVYVVAALTVRALQEGP